MKRNLIISIIIIGAVIGGYFWLKGGEQSLTGDNSTTYTNSTYDFSLSLPEGAQASSFQEGEGEMVLITNDKLLMTNGEQNFQMQIYISYFDEDIVLTAERIKQDLPEMAMESPEPVKVGEIPAVSFLSVNEQGQKTKEVWLVYKNNLYQISSLIENENQAAEIIKSWQWQ